MYNSCRKFGRLQLHSWVMRSSGIDRAVALQVARRIVSANYKIFFINGLRISGNSGELQAQRNSTSASMVSWGRSSISQCPLPFNSITLRSVATRFICGPRIAALAFSPAIDKTGMVN